MRTARTARVGVVAMAFLTALAFFAAGPGQARRTKRAQAPAPPRITVVPLDDGMTLVYVPRLGAEETGLSYVVFAGSFEDPAHKGGLAHLLEHIVLHGSYQLSGGKLSEEVRARGGHMSALTSTGRTLYALDAPKDDFLAAMRLYVQTITNPALRLAELDRERRIVDTEHVELDARSMLWALDQQIFPSANRGPTVMGTKASRSEVGLDDLISFYQRHYVPSNTVVVVAGDLPLADVRRALEESVLQPPVVEGGSDDDRPSPNVPSSVRLNSSTTAIASAFHFPDTEPDVCDDVARLLDLRLMERVRIQEPLASNSRALCHRTRGTSFLVTVATTRTLEGSRLPQIMKQIVMDAKRRPPSTQERRSVQSRHALFARQLLADPAALARAVAFALEPGDEVERRIERMFRAPRLDWRAMRAALERNAVDEHHVLVQVSPFAQD